MAKGALSGGPSGTPVSISDLNKKIDNILSMKKNKKLSKKDLETIAKDYSMDELLTFQDSALGDTTMSNDDKIAILGNISSLLKTKKNAESKLSKEDANKKEKEHKKQIDELTEQKRLQGKEAEKLKKNLLGKETEIQEKDKKISEKEQKIEELDKENAKKLDELLEEKKKGTGNEEKIKALQNDIKNLQEQKKDLEEKIGPVPTYINTGDGYKDGKIIKLKTRWINAWLAKKQIVDGRTEIQGPGLSFVRNLHTRRKLNKTIKKFNKIGDDEIKGLKYFLAKTEFIKGGKISMGVKRIRNYFSIRNHKQLDETFAKQKEIFLDNLKKKMGKKGTSEADNQTIKAIEDRLDYYHKKYKRTFITL